MRLWLDAQLSPAIAEWISATFGLEAVSVIDLKLEAAKDPDLFRAARGVGVALMSKDADIPMLLTRHGPPPQVIHLTCGNTSNAELKRILTSALLRALELLHQGEAMIEIGGPG